MGEMSPYSVVPEKVKRRVRLVAVTQNPIDVVNVATGEVQRATPYVGNRAWRDISEFVKVYDLGKLVSLGQTEMKVFCYLLSEVDFGGKVEMDEGRCCSFSGLGRRSVFYGLKGLIEKDFIRRDGGGSYWVNPNIAFRGSRDELMYI